MGLRFVFLVCFAAASLPAVGWSAWIATRAWTAWEDAEAAVRAAEAMASVALGSGTSGGVLAPLLMMGGALGALVSGFLPVGDAGLWATVGMAAMMGGTMRSPLTAMVFTPVSYVAPAREISILVGTLLGAHLLSEEHATRRLFGAGAMVAGIVCLAVG